MSAHRRNRLLALLHASRRRPARTATLGLLVAVLSATAGLGIALTSQSEPEPAQASTARTDERASRGKPRTVPPATPTSSVAPKPVSPSPAKPAITATRKAAPTATRSTPAPAPVGCGSYSGNRLTACRLLSSYGFSTRQMPALDQLWTHESNWRHTATNPSSGAYGIPQALPGSKMGSVASDWRTNPATQIRWGLGYIRQVYGTPANAWAHFQSHNWY